MYEFHPLSDFPQQCMERQQINLVLLTQNDLEFSETVIVIHSFHKVYFTHGSLVDLLNKGVEVSVLGSMPSTYGIGFLYWKRRVKKPNEVNDLRRLDQYIHIQSEAPEVIEHNRPTVNWPTDGKILIQYLQELLHRPVKVYETPDHKPKGPPP